MIQAFFFLLLRSWKNRVFSRLRRLRQPKYLISAIAGLGYIYMVFLHQALIHRSRIPRATHALDPAMIVILEAAFAVMLLAAILFQWFFLNTKTPLFNETETQFLFPAPVSRGALLNYRIAKAQIGILFGTLISLLLINRGGLFRNSIFPLITIWLVYTFLYLTRVAILLQKQSLERQGVKGRERKTLVLGSMLVVAILLFMSARWFYLPVPIGKDLTPENLVLWLKSVTGSGPVFYLLLPFRLMIRPAFSPGVSDLLIRLVPVFVMMAAVYTVIRLSRAGFEEAVLGPLTGRDAAAGTAGKGFRRPRRPPFQLAPEGYAPIAIYWKNLSLVGGLSLRQTVPGLAALTVVIILIVGASGESAPVVIGSMSAALAGFLALMGPLIIRDDLRSDLKNMDLLKGYPIPGWGIILGEVMAPVTMLSIFQWLLVLLASGVLPSLEEHPWPLSYRIYIGFAAALLLPCLSLIGVLVQNAVALILPGWVQLERENQRGVEAMGQRLISGVAMVVSLIFASIPAAVLFAAVWFTGFWLIGTAVIPVAALAAAAGLIAEAAVGIVLLGRLFEKFDVTREIKT